MGADASGLNARRGSLSTRQALALGVIQGPAELLPISSSAHLLLVPWLLGWRSDDLGPGQRRAFEVALHAGCAAALAIGQRRSILGELRALGARAPVVLAPSLIPPAVAGYWLERRTESVLKGPLTVACGLLAGSVGLVICDRRPERRGRGQETVVDGIALGIAQAAALAPGVSRSGATQAAARWRGFTRDHAAFLASGVALPVIAGATALKAARLRSKQRPPGLRRPMAAGVAASFVSTLVSQRLIPQLVRGRPLWPYAAYRLGLAGLVAVKLAASQTDRTPSAGAPTPDAALRSA
jgi:undecaprenyl-diphosphatase